MITHMSMASMEYEEKPGPGVQRVAVMSSPFNMDIRYARIPEPGDDEVRVRIKYVGICGSDLEAYRGTRAPEFITTPARLGHEVAGTIDRVGGNVAGIKSGDRVTCRYVWGAFAEYIVCKPFQVKVLPPSIPMKEASLIEILPSVLHAVEIAAIGPTKNVLIMGQGVSGLTLTQVAALHSPRALAVTDIYERNLALAMKYGASHAFRIPCRASRSIDTMRDIFPQGFDVVIPCLLEGDGVADAIDCCATGAKIVLYGCIGVCNKPIDFFKVHRRRIDIYTTEPKRDIDNRRFFDEGVRLVADGLVNTAEIVDAVVPLSDIVRGFHLRNAETEDVIHVLIDCEA